jgi:hypothetical protein
MHAGSHRIRSRLRPTAQPGPRDSQFSSCTDLSVCTACLLSLNACSHSILLHSHHANTIHTQFRPFSAHAPPVRPQSAPEPSQHMHPRVSRIIQAHSGTITPFFSSINLHHSNSLVHTVPAPVPSSMPLQHPRSSQSSIQCTPSSTSLPGLHRGATPAPASFSCNKSCFHLVLVCVQTPTSPHAPIHNAI